jgi:hypothetical protein
MDMESASPAVSPSVVAAILMIQNAMATSGTLLVVAQLRFVIAEFTSCRSGES